MSVTCKLSEGFWQRLMDLRDNLVAIDESNKFVGAKEGGSNIFKTQKSITRLETEEILTKIECLVESMLGDLTNGRPMKFVFNKRGYATNTRFNHRVGLQMEGDAQMTVVSLEKENSLNKFAVMLKALSLCYQLLQSNSYTTKRDLYYMDKNLFSTQQVVDEAFNDIACMLQVPRNSLHVLASPKGIVVGNLVYKDEEDNYIDCSQSKMGTMVPSRVDDVHEFYSKARFVLLVEKEASFQRLNDADVISKLGPCLMITAKGFPDINTRIFLRKIWENLKIPILALMDADPHGIEIMCVYRFGSKSLTFDSENLTCPSIRWLGVLPTDIERMGIPSEALISATENDLKKMTDLLKRPYIQGNKDISDQITKMLALKKKAEIECLEAVSSTFAADIYLPHKIRSGDWL